MTKERARKIAELHALRKFGEISYCLLDDGRTLYIQTLVEPNYYESNDYVTYIDVEDKTGTIVETHTTYANDVEGIAFWVYEMCYGVEERS